MKDIFSFKNVIIGLVVLVIAFFAWSKVTSIMKADAPVEIAPVSNDHTFGNPNAKVTVVEFADFQCPACKAFDPIIDTIMGEYGDRVQFIFRHFPLTQIHQNAMLAANVAEAVSVQGKFWEFKKLVYEKQEEWASSLDAKTKLIGYAESLGVDVNQLNVDLASSTIRDKVIANQKEALALQLPGTPSIIINNVKVNNSSVGSLELFRKYLDDELAKVNGTASTSTTTVNAANVTSASSTMSTTSTGIEVSTSSVKVNYTTGTATPVKSN